VKRRWICGGKARLDATRGGRGDQVLERRRALYGHDADASKERSGHAGKIKHALDRIEPARGKRVFAAPLALVASQDVRGTDIAAAPACIADGRRR
jgi:hypothetical protein